MDNKENNNNISNLSDDTNSGIMSFSMRSDTTVDTIPSWVESIASQNMANEDLGDMSVATQDADLSVGSISTIYSKEETATLPSDGDAPSWVESVVEEAPLPTKRANGIPFEINVTPPSR